MKRLTIPVFSGEVKEYREWKAAFDATIGCANVCETEKMLHLITYLAGGALRMIKSLGYSADAYLEALRLLDERYGGDARRYITITKEVEQFRPIREDNLRDLEEFLNLLSVLIVEFKDNKRKSNLEDGFLYQK